MKLDEIATRYWQTELSYSPTVATIRGVHDYDDQLRGFDDDWLGEMADRFRSIRDAAAALPADELTIQERITRELLIHHGDVVASEIEHRYMVAPLDPFLGVHTRLLSDSRLNTVKDASEANALLGRYAAVPAHLEGAMRLQRANAEAGMTPALASIDRVLDQLDRYLASDLSTDPFLALDHDDDTWRQKATDLVTGTIRPAMEAYRNDIKAHIAPVARPQDRCGLTWMTNGEEIYAGLVRKYTQLDTPTDEIHQIGQHWATEVNAAEWVTIGQSAFGLGSLEEVFDRLHADPSLRFRSPEHMLEHARGAVDRAWDAVGDWFGARPDTPCTVVPVPEAMAPAMPPAYYQQPPLDGSRPGTYYLNTHKHEERDLFEYESIHFHEGVPGHHFDRSLATEVDGIPTFRRYTQIFAHTEGWGLYSERLADEMGLYSSDVDRLGMVSADAWRAGRLVTDTGLHALGWSREQAIEFLLRWTPIGRLTVEQEVDRYIGMPGQALSYKMGQLEILRLRDQARSEMGSDFDIKGFHDTMLIHGAMPLPMLSVAVADWIETRS